MKKLFTALAAAALMMTAGTVFATDNNSTDCNNTPPPPPAECDLACQQAKMFKGSMMVESFDEVFAYGDKSSAAVLNDTVMRFKQGNPEEGTGADVFKRFQYTGSSENDDGSGSNAGGYGIGGIQWQGYGSLYGSSN